MIVLGEKKIMSQVRNKYYLVAATLLDVTDCVVAGKRKLEDGRTALLIGYGKKKKPTKPEIGQFKELGYVPSVVRQVIVEPELYEKLKIGDSPYEFVEAGIKVDVFGKSKGKGFAGVIKRWGFSGGPKTHGQSDRHRAIGAIGAQTPGRVFKGKKMAGRHGNKNITVKNLEVLEVFENNNRKYILLKGAVPGPYGAIVGIKLAKR